MSHYRRGIWLAWWGFGQIKEFERSDSGQDRCIIIGLKLRAPLVFQRCNYFTAPTFWYEKSALFQEESILFCYTSWKDFPALGSSKEEVELFGDCCQLIRQYLIRTSTMCHRMLIKTRDRKKFQVCFYPHPVFLAFSISWDW
jgi:hypothetical protein